MSMKKSIILLFFIASMQVFSQSVNTHQISIDEARQIAADFFGRSSSVGARPSRVKGNVARPALAYKAGPEESTSFYVFNNASDGFVIIGGNSDMPSILGFSDNGSFDYEKAPDNFVWWLKQYEKCGTLSRTNGISSRKSIKPLLTTTWGQDKPYNNAIPGIGGNYKAFVTGCTSTAISQIMRYYKYPQKGRGETSYTIKYNSGEFVLTFSADFGNTTYDWDNMLDDYSAGYNQIQADAVATLMYHVAVSEQTRFGSRGSSADSRDGATALINNFNYDKGLMRGERNYFTDEEWEEIIYNELANGRPVLYDGVSITEDGKSGHAFVCHGYNEDDNMFAINWGWNGLYDGYYALTGKTALNPDTDDQSEGEGFTSNQTIYYNIKPDEGGESVVCLASKDAAVLSEQNGDVIELISIDRAKGTEMDLNFRYTPYNLGLAHAFFHYGIIIRNIENGHTYYKSDGISLLPSGYFYSLPVSISFNTSMIPNNGIYEVLPAYSLDDGTTWDVMQYNVSQKISRISISGGENEESVNEVETIFSGTNNDIRGIYNLEGKRIPHYQKGLNVVKYSNGMTRKVFME